MSSRPSYLEISKHKIINNYKTYQSNAKKIIFPVIKANAYGVGMLEMAKLFADLKVGYLCVATFDEAITLRNANVKTAILVMGYTPISDLKLAKELDITIALTSKEFAQGLLETDINDLKLHIKINTSMNRLGFNSLQDLNTVFTQLKDKHRIEGVFTHYAKSDETSLRKDFNKFKSIVTGLDYPFTYIHASSSNSSLHYHESFTNAARVGMGLYDSSIDPQLENSLRLVSHVVNINKISNEDKVGYEGNYQASKETYIATIPIGYADGILRQDTGQMVYINNKAYPIIGNICMDQLMIEIDDSVSLMDEVEFFGKNQSLQTYAKHRSTISYEIIAILSNRLTRKYID